MVLSLKYAFCIFYLDELFDSLDDFDYSDYFFLDIFSGNVQDPKGLKLKLKFSVLQSRTNKKPY